MAHPEHSQGPWAHRTKPYRSNSFLSSPRLILFLVFLLLVLFVLGATL